MEHWDQKCWKTIKVTTYKGIRLAIMSISWRFWASWYYGMKHLNSKFSTDTFYPRVKSFLGHTHVQVYLNKLGVLCFISHLQNKWWIHWQNTQIIFTWFWGTRSFNVWWSHATSWHGHKVHEAIKEHDMQHHISAPRRPNGNLIEGSRRKLKRRWYRIMTKRNVPKRIWDFGFIWIYKTGNLLVSSSKYVGGVGLQSS